MTKVVVDHGGQGDRCYPGTGIIIPVIRIHQRASQLELEGMGQLEGTRNMLQCLGTVCPSLDNFDP